MNDRGARGVRSPAEALVLGAIFLDLFGFGMLIPDVQYRAEALGLPGWAIGAALTMTFVVQFVVSPLWGRASDRFGRKYILVTCAAFSASGLFVYGFATLAWVIFASRLLSGLGGANVAVAQAYLSDISSEANRTAALGRLGAAVSAGLIAGSASVALPFHGNPGFVAGALSLAGVSLLLFLPRETARLPVAQRRAVFDFTLLRTFPALRSLVIVAVVAWLSLATLEGTFGRLIERTLGFHRTQFGQVFAFESVVGVLAQGVLLAWLVRRTQDGTRLRLAYVAQGAGLALMPFAPSLGALFLMSALYAAGAGVANGTINGLCSRLTPDDRQGELFGLMQGARSIGFAFGPTIGGALFDRMPASPYMLAGGTCVLAALLVRIPREEHAVTIRRYLHGSLDYAGALQLRRRVLRGPLGLTYSEADLAQEADDIHVGAFDADEAIGTLILTPEGGAAKMRQVAVAPERQGEGIGRRLVEYSESVARESGFTEMALHARETAVSFYERLGYEVVGEPFIEVTIPHRAMRKKI